MAKPIRLENTRGGARKFWEAATHGAEVRVTFGRIGTAGRTLVAKYSSAAEARKEAAKLVAGKRREGYVGGEAAPAPARPTKPAKGLQPAVVVQDSYTGVVAMYVDGRDLWFAQVWEGDQGAALLQQGGTLAEAVAKDGAVERWRFGSEVEASRAAKWVVGHAKRSKLANDAGADVAAWAKRLKKERPCVPRFEVGSGPVALTRDRTHPWIFPRPPATSFLSGRTMVPVFSLVGPIDPRFGERAGVFVSVCPQALLDPYVEHVFEVVVQDPAQPSKCDAYFERRGGGFWTVHLGLQVAAVDGGSSWAVTQHSGERGTVGWVRTTHHRSRAEAEKVFKERVEQVRGYARVARPGPYYAKLLDEITRINRVPNQRPEAVKLRVAHAAMVQSVAGASTAPSGWLVSRSAVRLGGTPRFCQEDWDFAPKSPGGGALIPIASLGHGDGPQWSEVLNDGDAGTINVYAAPGEPFGAVSFSCH